MSSSLRDLVADRTALAGLVVVSEVIDSLTGYLTLLARWNRRINLTSFDLDAPTDGAIDRLIVEPLLSAKWLPDGGDLAVDIGSGGGSPAIPLKIARPGLRMVLVEVRARKSAFLREVARELSLANLSVETARFEDYCRAPSAPRNQVGVVTMRAVRADEDIWRDLLGLLSVGGRLIWFTDVGYKTNNVYSEMELISSDPPAIVLQKKQES